MKVSSAPFLLLRIPSLKLRVRGRKEAFEANLKTETELWNLMVKEMWAGRNMADQHKVKHKAMHLCVSVCMYTVHTHTHIGNRGIGLFV